MQTYDPKLVSLIIDGTFITGFMDGTFITASKNTDNATPHVGAKGDVSIAENADETGTITFTLAQTSPSLPFIIALSKQKRFYKGQVIDGNTNKLKTGGSQCRILKTPDIGYAAEVTGVEVQLFVADYSVS